MKIPLNKGMFAEIDGEDFPLIAGFKWYVFKPKNISYAATHWQENHVVTSFSMHRLILGAKKGEIVDHRDGNGLNNRRSNIWIATACQNQQNRHSANTNSSTGVTGVYLDRQGRFAARIDRDLKQYYLGAFATIEEAAAARAEAERKHQMGIPISNNFRIMSGRKYAEWKRNIA
jgi:hypothetical protein